MSDEEKFIEIVGDKRFLRKPLSEKTKDKIIAMVQKIGSLTIAEIGANIERDLRDYQLMEKTGRLKAWISILHENNLETSVSEKTEETIFDNRQWIWQLLRVKVKAKIAELPDSFLKKEPPLRYKITCECGRTTEVEAIGPFSALAKVKEFPIDDFGRFKFWNHTSNACMESIHESGYCPGKLIVEEI